MKLTDTSIKTALREAAQAGKQGRKIFDGRGLYLIPRPNNVGWWRFKYRHRGREKCISLGTYPDVSLKRARDKRDEARSLVAEGTDPSAQRKVDRMAGDFKALANDWLEKKGASLDESTFTIAKQRFERYVFPHIGDKPPKKIEPADVLYLLRRIEEAGKLETAHRVRQLIGQAFRYGVGLGLADRDPTADLKGVLKTAEVKHMAAITVPSEVGKLLRAIDGYNDQTSTEIALKLLPLVFVRPGELRQATWQEIDLDSAVWRIPASRMKMKREHIVPLSKQAIGLLYEIKRVTGKRPYVFESLRRGRPLSENTINGALRALG